MRGKRTVHRLRSRGKLGAARLSEELEALRQFQAVTFGLTSETEIRTLLDRILAAAMEITEADFGNISLPDPVTGDLQIAVQRRFDAEFVDYFNSLPLERGACGKAFAAGQRVIVEDVATDPLFDDESGEVLRNAKVRAVQSTPLTGFSGKVVGVISTHYRVPRKPPARGLRLLDLLARQAGDLIERAMYREQLETLVSERTRELEEKNRALSKQAETVHELSANLLHAQDEERRRIARDLHDTTAQEIGSMAIALGHLAKNFGAHGLDARKIVAENAESARRALEELRTLSYLLHPPLLDELGFRSALFWYAEGFEKRSGIRVEVKVANDLPRLSQEVELALFRIVQEALTNVHRYSGSKTARIEMAIEHGTVRLVIEDQGKGMPVAASQPTKQNLGVGIPGMRERVRQFGGNLVIDSSDRGTRIIVTLSLEAAQPRLPSSEPVTAAPVAPLVQKAPSQKERILLVDDHELMRAGVRTILQGEQYLEICGEASTGQDAISQALKLRPDLVLLDLSLPDMGGFMVSAQLRKKGFTAPILVLTVHSSRDLVKAVQRTRHCQGYVQKATASQELVHAIRTVLNGETFFPPAQAAAAKAH